MANRQNEILAVEKLQHFLGSDYSIHYDSLDSGMTYCYYKGEFYKRFPNSELNGSLNVIDYTAPMELKLRMADVGW